MKKHSALLVCLALMVGLAACGGSSEADKAWDNWLKVSNELETAYEKNSAQVEQGDYETGYALLTEYYQALQTAYSSLQAIDTSKLSAQNKADATATIEAFPAKMQQVEQGLAQFEELMQQ